MYHHGVRHLEPRLLPQSSERNGILLPHVFNVELEGHQRLQRDQELVGSNGMNQTLRHRHRRNAELLISVINQKRDDALVMRIRRI